MADQLLSTDPAAGLVGASAGGLLTPGTVDLFAQPSVDNPDGSTSTVDSRGFNMGGKEVLLPSVTPDGRHLQTDAQILNEYKKTGRHLGIFDTPAHATAYAQQLHEDYARGKYARGWSALPSEQFLSADPMAGRAPDFQGTNEKDPSGSAVVAGVSKAWEAVTTPLLPEIAEATRAIANHIDAPTLGVGTPVNGRFRFGEEEVSKLNAQLRGFFAGATVGTGDVLTGLSSSLGIALSLAGIGPAGSVARRIPALKPLLQLPAVQALQRAVQATAGAGFTAQGASRVATAPTVGEKLQGVAETASGLVGVATGLPTMRVRVTPGLPKNPNLAEAAAVQFGQARGVPIDAGTASGNRFVTGTQAIMDESLGGSMIASKAKHAQAEALQRVGGELADVAHPNVATPEQAGQGITDALTTKIQAHDALANAAYEKLRAFEADPAHARTVQVGTEVKHGQTVPVLASVALPVNLRPFRAAMQRPYEQWLREAELVPLHGDKGLALTALDRLMRGPDAAPLSVVDAALGDIKAMARGANLPELRTQGQGLMAAAVKQLDGAVRRAAVHAGPNAIRALEQGRGATVAKYQTAEVLDLVRTEPVRAYRQVTAPGDSAIAQLKTLSAEAPQAIPKLARAYLDSLLEMASAEGGFGRADRLQAEWRKLGPATKEILFPQQGQVAALDNFFLLAKKVAERPNPSGSALTLWKGGELTALVTHPLVGVPASAGMTALSALLHSRAGVRALTHGLTLSMGGARVTAATRAATVAEIVSAGRALGLPMAVPQAAETTPERGRP